MVKFGDTQVMEMTFAPGWKWSNDIGKLSGSDVCPAHHRGYQVKGRMHVKMNDGSEYEVGPGEVCDISPGHDAWVVGDEPVVLIDFGAPNVT